MEKNQELLKQNKFDSVLLTYFFSFSGCFSATILSLFGYSKLTFSCVCYIVVSAVCLIFSDRFYFSDLRNGIYDEMSYLVISSPIIIAIVMALVSLLSVLTKVAGPFSIVAIWLFFVHLMFLVFCVFFNLKAKKDRVKKGSFKPGSEIGE